MAYEVNTILEQQIHYTANNQQCINVVHWVPNQPGIGPIQDLVLSFLGLQALNNAGTFPHDMAALMSNEVDIHTVTMQVIYPTRYVKLSVDVVIPGANAFTCNAQNLAAVFTKRGVQANKQNVGSFHLGGIPNNMSVFGELNKVNYSVPLGVMADTLAAQFADAGAGVTYTPVIANRTTVIVDGKPHTRITNWKVINEAFVQPQTRTMRRRTVGLGI